MDSLEDEDTYIYLSCINGLVSSARYRTEPVLDTLTREFTQVRYIFCISGRTEPVLDTLTREFTQVRYIFCINVRTELVLDTLI